MQAAEPSGSNSTIPQPPKYSLRLSNQKVASLPVCQSAYPGIASWNNPKASALKGSPGAWHLTKLSRADLSRSPRGGKEKKCVVRTVPSACHPAILATHLCRRGGPAGRPKRIDEVGKWWDGGKTGVHEETLTPFLLAHREIHLR